MKTIVTGQVLGRAARAVKGIAGNGSYMPALLQARVNVLPGIIQISGTNLETWVNYRIECNTGYDTAGLVFVDADRLLGSTKSLKGAQDIGIDAAGVLTIGSLTLPGNPDMAIDYPIQPDYELEKGAWTGCFLELSGAEFKGLIKRHKATSKKSGQTTRLSLTCVNIDYAVDGSGARFTTTDGYSLNTEAYGSTLQKEDTRQALVDMGALQKAAAAAGARDTVSLVALKDQGHTVIRVTITSAAACIDYYIRTISETFPDFQRVIPSSDAARASFSIDPVDLCRVVAGARVTAPEDSEAVTLEVLPGDIYGTSGPVTFDRLQVSSTSPAGSFSEAVDIQRRRGFAYDKNLEPVSFNAAYLLAIGSFSDSPIELHLSGPLQAARFDYGLDKTAVLMPVNLKDRK